jgi:hypothetical protein
MGLVTASDGVTFDPDSYSKSLTVDASDRVTAIDIVLGSRGTYRISMSYTGTNTNPDVITCWVKQA